ncbi:DUF502 domain-containing protein [Spirulina sp. CS-785/01]|uniref:DUF502 domain-containing protein n=1 Tax=Spirulina sp. CS-785/01 TaxID=3021716 RepID=UPI00232D2804|nr:DUF502 domain-containing protein [Spirulina sp. CS-785/01]MDB9313408.1 DUF502 domain-containing protein [Spirulina sp. CS-785/01]
MLQRFKQDLKNDLIAGLLVVIPLATTIWLTFTIARWVISFLTEIPKQLNPFPGLHPILVNLINLSVGFAVPLIFILLIGLMARNIVGRWLLEVGERILQGIPLAGSIYKTLKQILETLLQDSKSKFRRVVMLEYPRRGVWSLGFVTGQLTAPLQAHLSEPMLSVFIPTTPNPTSGWYAIVPETEVINLAISIEDAFKVLISGGIVSPKTISPPDPRPSQSTSVPINLTKSGPTYEPVSVEGEHPEVQPEPRQTLSIEIEEG